MLLAVLVAVGLSVSVVQASGMAVKMAMTRDMNTTMMPMGATAMPATSHADDGTCPACPKSAGDSESPMHCPPACTTPVLGVLPQELAATTIGQTTPLFLSPSPLLRGHVSLPDPSPPRPNGLV